jgi:NADPH-dependent glutamate synthase beta subunit-like oxidoreductase/Pyruvate/2-oxoacid:ferredoxin oxidoreductase delta subunit
MNKDVLVIGAGIAGLQAALDLADSGLEVHLIESSPFFNVDDGTNLPAHLLRVRQLEVLKHPNIHVRTNVRLARVEGKANDFQLELRQHPRYIDLTKCTACGDCVEACPVTLPGRNHKAIHLDGQPGCMAIEKAGKSPCAHTCPAGIHVQGYVALIAQGRFREAVDLIREAMPFPSVCGRVCNHYCEAECTRGKVDEPVSIMALKRYVADWEYSHWGEDSPRIAPNFPATTSGKRIAIIGAGPAGLTAARDLNRLGHAVTVFDALPVAGGMMRVGIPAHRLPDELLDWEIQQILDEGGELRLNTRVDNIPGLFEDGYEAVLIATGAHVARKIPIPNAEHPDNWLSLDVLRRASLGEGVDLRGKRIIVLGGGNVALDTARTVLRLGADAVSMACLETRGEMPGFQWEILVAEEEGIQLYPGRTFKEMVVEDGRIIGVRCVEVVFRGFKDGRPDIDEIPNTGHILPADIVIWAIGQGADLSFLPRDSRIQTRKPAGIQSDAEMMTTMPGVFVAGDVHRGVTFFVVDAIGEGHKAARSIDRYVRGEAGSVERASPEKVKYSKQEIQAKYSQASQVKRVQIASIPLEARANNFREVDLTITEEQAITEARRCLVCGPCSECQACVQVCKAGAISHEQRETDLHLNVGAIICADESEKDLTGFSERLADKAPRATKESVYKSAFGNLSGLSGVYRVAPEDPLSASAVAADILGGWGKRVRPSAVPPVPVLARNTFRIGVFVCECGGQISSILDTGRMRRKLAALPGVVHAQVLPFSCSSEAAQTICAAVDAHQLDKAVLAACSCCSMDQACFSCTYQRLRCRRDLGVLPCFDGSFPGLDTVRFAFVNIREQCAWVHADQPGQATATAITLITAAVAGLRKEAVRPKVLEYVERSALILGRGEAASICKELLERQGVSAERARGMPDWVRRTGGRYLASRGKQTWGGEALILAPRDAEEAGRLRAAFGREELRPRVRLDWGGLATHRPGVYFCDPALDPGLTGRAAAARAAAWLGRVEKQIPSAATVDPALCRACGTCVEICEFGASELTGETPVRSARIDPLICMGCGTCASHCPSGAIRLACDEEAKMETALSALLVVGD